MNVIFPLTKKFDYVFLCHKEYIEDATRKLNEKIPEFPAIEPYNGERIQNSLKKWLVHNQKENILSGQASFLDNSSMEQKGKILLV